MIRSDSVWLDRFNPSRWRLGELSISVSFCHDIVSARVETVTTRPSLRTMNWQRISSVDGECKMHHHYVFCVTLLLQNPLITCSSSVIFHILSSIRFKGCACCIEGIWASKWRFVGGVHMWDLIRLLLNKRD